MILISCYHHIKNKTKIYSKTIWNIFVIEHFVKEANIKRRLFELTKLTFQKGLRTTVLLSLATVSVKSNQPKIAFKTMTSGKGSTSINYLLPHADQLFDENHFEEALELLKTHPKQNNSEIQWRKGRALYKISNTMTDKKHKIEAVREAFSYLEEALKQDDNNFAIHKWYGILLDAKGEIDGIRARASQLETLKYHMTKASELNPNDSTSWYLLGAFEYNMAELPWYQRKIVATFFANPPSGSYEKALEYFLKAENIKENFYSTNHLMLGKCYRHFKDMENAKKYLTLAANCKVLNDDDKKCKEEATEILKKI